MKSYMACSRVVVLRADQKMEHVTRPGAAATPTSVLHVAGNDLDVDAHADHSVCAKQLVLKELIVAVFVAIVGVVYGVQGSETLSISSGWIGVCNTVLAVSGWRFRPSAHEPNVVCSLHEWVIDDCDDYDDDDFAR